MQRELFIKRKATGSKFRYERYYLDAESPTPLTKQNKKSDKQNKEKTKIKKIAQNDYGAAYNNSLN